MSIKRRCAISSSISFLPRQAYDVLQSGAFEMIAIQLLIAERKARMNQPLVAWVCPPEPCA
jgi:hypothetical protein